METPGPRPDEHDGSQPLPRLDGVEVAAARWRSDQAVAERRRRWWLSAQTSEEVTLDAVLRDAAERDQDLLVSVLGAGRHRGRVDALSSEVVVLHTEVAEVAIRVGALTSVQRAPGSSAPLGGRGERSVSSAGTLREALAARVGEQPEVSVLSVTGERWRGRLCSVGIDVIGLRLEGSREQLYVALEPVALVSLGSG